MINKGDYLLDSPTVLPIVLLVESKTMSEPKSLQEAIVYFSNPDNCIDYLQFGAGRMALSALAAALTR